MPFLVKHQVSGFGRVTFLMPLWGCGNQWGKASPPADDDRCRSTRRGPCSLSIVRTRYLTGRDSRRQKHPSFRYLGACIVVVWGHPCPVSSVGLQHRQHQHPTILQGGTNCTNTSGHPSALYSLHWRCTALHKVARMQTNPLERIRRCTSKSTPPSFLEPLFSLLLCLLRQEDCHSLFPISFFCVVSCLV